MATRRLTRPGALGLASWLAMMSLAGTLHAATFPEFVDPNPAPGNAFGNTVVALSTGNVVITSRFDDAGGTDAGAVYLFNGATGALISTLRGSTANDRIGNGGVTALANGNYVVQSLFWNNGAVAVAGAVTWASGTTGVSGVVSATNSLVGSTANDQVGGAGVIALTNGNYVVRSSSWDNGAIVEAGAVTWGSGTTGMTGVVSAANSLVGSTANDQVGDDVLALTNGNYVVRSSIWDNGAIANAGAVTWCNGTTGRVGPVSAANSLVGSTAGDAVGSVTALTNGNYVVASPYWDNGAVTNVGAATWCNGTSGRVGVVSTGNSLIGSAGGDYVGSDGVTALMNGNYVVRSSGWDNGAIVNVQVGAATWCNGAIGRVGVVSAANSLIGSTASDQVGKVGVTALTNGNYVVASPSWDNGAIASAGAATWCSGTTGRVGVVSAANSLVGSTASDDVGLGGVTALTNGNYVVRSTRWDNGAIVDAGAATWCNGTTGRVGVVSAANSLVGSTADDLVGSWSVTALTDGNYVVSTLTWNSGAISNVGAATWGSGTTGVTGVVSAANSLVGSTTNDEVGGAGVVALANGSYVVRSPNWENGAIYNAGAVTWCNGTSGGVGVVSAANSLVGSAANDFGSSGVTALTNGNYVVVSPNWDSGALLNAGAVTWGSGTNGVNGVVSAGNSLIGESANTNVLLVVVADDVNGTFFGRFLGEGGGRVRVDRQDRGNPEILSVLDVPNDQGRQVRLSFARSGSDAPENGTPVLNYLIYRREIVALSAAASLAKPLNAVAPNQALLASWDYLMTVPATSEAVYQVVVPTLADSNATGFHREVLFVRAATATPGIYYDSAPDSGWSADNLPPAPPAPFVAAYAGGATNLHWGRNSEPDLWYYAIYRGTTADFVPGPGNLISTRSDTGYVDAGPAGSFYKLSAVDVNGNESSFRLLTPTGTTSVDDGLPIVFALAGARPNPARGRGLNVVFALPTGAAARLELLDLSGRRVLAREVGPMGVGRHTVDLAQSRSVAPGLYWLQLSQGTNRQTKRVAVVE